MKLIKNIFIKLIWIILILLVAFNVYNFVSINVLKKDITSVNGYAFLEVVSGSMEPTIKIGDIIVIDTKEDDYKEGDIITFYDINGSFVTHRLMSISDGKMVTKGDANDSEDEEMESKAIVGKYVTKINGAGKLMASLKNPLVMILILVIGIVLCLLMSTDENLLPKDLTEEEKAYLEYKKLYKEKPKKNKNKKPEEIKEEEKKEVVVQEALVIGEIIEVSVEELEEQERETINLREQLKEELRRELKEELRKEIQQENKNKKKNKRKYYNKQQANKQKNNSNKKHQQKKNKYNGNKNQTRK